MVTESFAGFLKPESNWHKIPNTLWTMELSIYERSIMQYLMRHTWGYQEFGITKHITLDEFQNGRKETDGTRMDKGVGFSKSMISRTLLHLEQRGFICIETDDRDKARIKKSYGIVIQLPQGEHSVHGENTAFTPETQRSPGERDQRKKLKKDIVKKETDRKTDNPPVANPELPDPESAVLSVSEIPENIELIFLDIPHGELGQEKYQPPEARAIVLPSKQTPVDSDDSSTPPPVRVSPLPEPEYRHNDLLEDIKRAMPGVEFDDTAEDKSDRDWKKIQERFETITGCTIGGTITQLLNIGISLRGVDAVVALIESSEQKAHTSRAGMVVKALKNWKNEPVPAKYKTKRPEDDRIRWSDDGEMVGYT